MHTTELTHVSATAACSELKVASAKGTAMPLMKPAASRDESTAFAADLRIDMGCGDLGGSGMSSALDGSGVLAHVLECRTETASEPCWLDPRVPRCWDGGPAWLLRRRPGCVRCSGADEKAWTKPSGCGLIMVRPPVRRAVNLEFRRILLDLRKLLYRQLQASQAFTNTRIDSYACIVFLHCYHVYTGLSRVIDLDYMNIS